MDPGLSQHTPTLELTLNISAVERDTGLSKDTLRIWERRYRFPQPARDPNGERVYSLGQVEKLRLIKRLMDQGHRPGQIIPRPLDELIALGSLREGEAASRPDLEFFLTLVKSHQLAELRRHLGQTLMKQGLQRFVLDTVAPLNLEIGEAWLRGRLALFEQRLYTEQVYALLRHALGSIQPQGSAPRVLLTTLPHESQRLGLLLLEALLAAEGAACVPLGTEAPMDEIMSAAQAQDVDVVALSFSASFGDKTAASALGELRARLRQDILLWAGGCAVERMRKPVPGVELFRSLEEVGQRVRDWQAGQP
jgi:MerR family transcriptional regulator, light-induced transcriptional regulator